MFSQIYFLFSIDIGVLINFKPALPGVTHFNLPVVPKGRKCIIIKNKQGMLIRFPGGPTPRLTGGRTSPILSTGL